MKPTKLSCLKFGSGIAIVDSYAIKGSLQTRIGQGTAPAYTVIRQQIAFIERDQVMYPHIETMHKLLGKGSLVKSIESLSCLSAFFAVSMYFVGCR